MEKKIGIIEEDWERVAFLDSIYAEEEELQRQKDYWEWVSQHEGKVVVEIEEETGEEVKKIIITDSLLPF